MFKIVLVIVNNQPVYVDFNEIKIDPKDIESVHVLKENEVFKNFQLNTTLKQINLDTYVIGLKIIP